MSPPAHKKAAAKTALGARVSPPAVSPTPPSSPTTKKETTIIIAGEDTRAPKRPKGWHRRGYLPHFDDQTKIQTITYRLADSLPQKLLERLANELENPAGDIAYPQRFPPIAALQNF